MTNKFEFEGQQIEALTNSDQWLAGETLAVEKWLGPLDKMSMYAFGLAVIAVSVKRANPWFKFEMVEKWPNELVGSISQQVNADDDAEDAADPTADPAAEPATT